MVSTPYHGYWKKLALAASGKMDGHFTALWDDGHIKFCSIATLTTLLSEAAFVDLHFERSGRIPALANPCFRLTEHETRPRCLASRHIGEFPVFADPSG